MTTALTVRPSAAVAETIERRLLMNGTTEAFSTLTSGDFNNDGDAESMVRVLAGRRRLADLGFLGGAFRRGALLLLDGSGALLGDPLGIRARGNAAPLAAAADFNSDGQLDVVLAGRRLSGARGGLTFLPGNGDGTFGTAVSVPGAPSNMTSLVAGDANGDGRVDLIGTARGRNVGNNRVGDEGLTFAVRQDRDTSSDNEGVSDDLGPSDAGASRPHLVGAGAEAGGGVITGSVLLPVSQSGLGGDAFADIGFGASPFDIDVALPPGFTPPASRVGASAEAGGARVGGFVDSLIDGGFLDDTDNVFVLFGNGDGTFSGTDNTNND